MKAAPVIWGLLVLVLQALVSVSEGAPPPWMIATVMSPDFTTPVPLQVPMPEITLNSIPIPASLETTPSMATDEDMDIMTTTSTPPTPAPAPAPPLHEFNEERMVEPAMDSEKIAMTVDKPLIYKSFEGLKPLDGKITFVPPKGHGLIAVIQELSLRTNTNICRFGVHFYPKCFKCVDYLQFSTRTQRSEKTCGDVDVNSAQGPLMTFAGDMAFVGGIDQELVVKLHQEAAFGLTNGPTFAVALTPYNDCGQTNETDVPMKKCPATRADAGTTQKESYCIYDDLFCDRILNCPVAGPQSSAFGLQNDETSCSFDYTEEAEENESDEGGEVVVGNVSEDDDDDNSYEIKVMSLQQIIKTDSSYYSKHTVIQFPDMYDEPATELPQTTGPTANANCQTFDLYDVLWWFVMFASPILGFLWILPALIRYCCPFLRPASSAPKRTKKARYVVPNKTPRYTRLDTIRFAEIPFTLPRTHTEEKNKMGQMMFSDPNPTAFNYPTVYNPCEYSK